MSNVVDGWSIDKVTVDKMQSDLADANRLLREALPVVNKAEGSRSRLSRHIRVWLRGAR